jgi:hypothetical protein
MQEAQAIGTMHIAWQSGETNIADVLAKLLSGLQLWDLICLILW